MKVLPLLECVQNQSVPRNFRLKVEKYIISLIKSEKYTSSPNEDEYILQSYFQNFMFDYEKIDLSENMPPAYKMYFLDVLGESYNNVIKEFKSSDIKCFNCEGPHIISACLLPMDFDRIAVNKAQFLGKFTQNVKSRYHIEKPSFSAFKPGNISLALTSALGLGKNELPSYIYAMRELSYPPGHFLDASESSGINIHMENSNDTLTNALDPNKIISYEGFNVPVRDKVKDEYVLYQSVPMQQHHSKDIWLKKIKEHLENNKPIESITNDLKNTLQPTLNVIKNNLNELNDESQRENIEESFEDNSRLEDNKVIKTSSIKGTPVYKTLKHIEQPPSLDNFSSDIQPFSVEDFTNKALTKKEIYLRIKRKVMRFKKKKCK